MPKPKMLLISESTVAAVLQYMQELSVPKVSVGEVQTMMQALMRLEPAEDESKLKAVEPPDDARG
jgi:DNA-binding transcriptional regulator LsrR (DeoR family)